MSPLYSNEDSRVYARKYTTIDYDIYDHYWIQAFVYLVLFAKHPIKNLTNVYREFRLSTYLGECLEIQEFTSDLEIYSLIQDLLRFVENDEKVNSQSSYIIRSYLSESDEQNRKVCSSICRDLSTAANNLNRPLRKYLNPIFSDYFPNSDNDIQVYSNGNISTAFIYLNNSFNSVYNINITKTPECNARARICTYLINKFAHCSTELHYGISNKDNKNILIYAIGEEFKKPLREKTNKVINETKKFINYAYLQELSKNQTLIILCPTTWLVGNPSESPLYEFFKRNAICSIREIGYKHIAAVIIDWNYNVRINMFFHSIVSENDNCKEVLYEELPKNTLNIWPRHYLRDSYRTDENCCGRPEPVSYLKAPKPNNPSYNSISFDQESALRDIIDGCTSNNERLITLDELIPDSQLDSKRGKKIFRGYSASEEELRNGPSGLNDNQKEYFFFKFDALIDDVYIDSSKLIGFYPKQPSLEEEENGTSAVGRNELKPWDVIVSTRVYPTRSILITEEMLDELKSKGFENIIPSQNMIIIRAGTKDRAVYIKMYFESKLFEETLRETYTDEEKLKSGFFSTANLLNFQIPIEKNVNSKINSYLDNHRTIIGLYSELYRINKEKAETIRKTFKSHNN